MKLAPGLCQVSTRKTNKLNIANTALFSFVVPLTSHDENDSTRNKDHFLGNEGSVHNEVEADEDICDDPEAGEDQPVQDVLPIITSDGKEKLQKEASIPFSNPKRPMGGLGSGHIYLICKPCHCHATYNQLFELKFHSNQLNYFWPLGVLQ